MILQASPEYEHCEVDVRLDESNLMQRVMCYIWIHDKTRLVQGWNYENWRRNHMEQFLTRISATDYS